MEPFEDENPFDNDANRRNSEQSSDSRVDLSEPVSPPSNGFSVVSPQPSSPSDARPSFPSSGSHRLPQAYKSDYCCSRDHWLHSGEDVEILVSCLLSHVIYELRGTPLDYGRSEDISELDFTIHHIRNQVRSVYIDPQPPYCTQLLFTRPLWRTTDTQNSNRCVRA